MKRPQLATPQDDPNDARALPAAGCAPVAVERGGRPAPRACATCPACSRAPTSDAFFAADPAAARARLRVSTT